VRVKSGTHYAENSGTWDLCTNWNDMLASLLGVCCAVPGLVRVPWKVTSMTAVRYGVVGLKMHNYCDVVVVAITGSLKMFLITVVV
jgi:hypothetical protein